MLYGVSTVVSEREESVRPTRSDESRLAVHPMPALGSLAGAILSVVGLAAIKPKYAATGAGAYMAMELLVLPELRR